MASLCRPPLPSPVFWVERSGRLWVAHVGESVHFKLLEHLGTGVSALPRRDRAGPQEQRGEGRGGSLGHPERGDGMLERFLERLLP